MTATSVATVGQSRDTAAPRDQFAGTGMLFRLALRRERYALPAWLLANAVVLGGTVAAYGATYTDTGARDAAVSRSDSVLLRALNGAPAGDSVGSLAVTDTFLITTTLASLMAVAMVLRHTRENDDQGRAELLASTAVGRLAPLLAALLLGVGACVALVPVLTLALTINNLPLVGSIAAATAIAAIGLLFAAVSTMTAQLWPSMTASTWDAILVISLVFLPRAFGDALGQVPPGGIGVSRGWLSWTSPVTWAQEIKPFHGDRWLMLLPLVALSALIAAQGFRLNTRREPGSSVIETARGPASAPPSLRGPWHLGLRLHRAALWAWVPGTFLGFLCAGLLGAPAVTSLPGADDAGFVDLVQRTLALPTGASPTVDDIFSVVVGVLVAIVAVCYVAHVLALLWREEATGGLAMTLACGVERTGWLLSRLRLGVLGLAAVVVAAGLGAGLGVGLRRDDVAGGITQMVAVALVQLPAALAFAGLAVAVFGALPRLFRPLLWAGPVVLAFLTVTVARAGLPGWVAGLSPMWHTRAFPVAEPGAGPVIGLILAAFVLATLGAVAFRRRDICR
ncbi:hypothetical protein AB0J14_22495 [Micromonospora arborensis]|uniref:hypothetical protein n=1 Tax=Micromonospora arborensis TaxID=2116518 RepID=UPI0033D2FFC7